MHILRLRIFRPSSSSHSGPFCNPANPLYQMRKSVHVLIGVTAALPPFHPGPSSNISNRILSLAIPHQIVTRFTRVLARQSNFQNAKDAKGLFAEPFNGNFKLTTIIRTAISKAGRWRSGVTYMEVSLLHG